MPTRRKTAGSNTPPLTSRNVSRIGLLTVGETARILGVSPSTLRLWENVGLITAARSDGRYRLYSRELLDVLKRIKYLRDVKLLTLPRIRQELGATGLSEAGKQTKATKTARPAPDLVDAVPPAVGSKLRALRQRAKLGVVEAARRARISAGFLSSIERGRANPSVATLQRLTATYNTTVHDFYDVARRGSRLVKPRQRRAIHSEAGVRIELLAPGARQLESHLFRVTPGAGSGGSYAHQGEEFIYMLTGQLELWLDELECHTLHEGDSFWFESTVGHRWFNSSDQDAVLLWINTPPTF
jgi:DNA-binding transcriptional MerR regulator/uncharacterized cupin superfamily protein